VQDQRGHRALQFRPRISTLFGRDDERAGTGTGEIRPPSAIELPGKDHPGAADLPNKKALPTGRIADRNTDLNSSRLGDSDSHRNSDRNGNGDIYANRYRHSVCNSHGDLYCDRHLDANLDCNGYGDEYDYGDCDNNGDRDFDSD